MKRNQIDKTKRDEKIFTHTMVWPALIILLMTSLLPLIYVIITSFTDMTLITMNRGGVKFIGLSNFVNAVKDPSFRHALWVTVKFTLFAVASETLLGLGLALFLMNFRRGSKVLRTLFLFPMLCPPITVALVWQTMFSNNNGILNALLGFFGLAPVNWLLDVKVAFYSVLLIDIWQYMPYVFLLVYVALCQMPTDLIEAATLDGANAWQRFRYVILPYLLKPLSVVVLLRTIDTFRLFDKVNVLTKGGPADSTKTITMYIYQTGVNHFDIGFTSATSILMTAVVLFLAAPYIRSTFRQMISRKAV